MKIYGRKSEAEIIKEGWNFICTSKDNERIYYSPDGKQRFAIYPNTWETFITNNNFFIKLYDRVFKGA